MNDKDRTKEQLVNEAGADRSKPGSDQSAEVRPGVTELEALEAERKRAKAALREAEGRYRGLFDGVPVGLYRTTPAGEILDANPALVQILGYPDRETLLAASAADVYLNAENRQQWHALIEREGVVRDFETQLRQRDGTIIWVQDTSRAVRDADGRMLCYEGSLEDITERKRAEEEMIRLSGAVRMSIDSIVISDVEAKIVEVNKATLEMYGTDDKSALIGKNALDLIAPEDREKAFIGIQEVLEKGHIKNKEYHIITKDGARIPVSMSVAVMKDADGKPLGFVAISRDITERKRAEEALRQRNRELALLNRAGQIFSSTLDLGQVLVTVLEEMRRLLDVTACSIWLSDPKTDDLVCQQVIGPQRELVHGWRLAPGEGLAGWVARSGESLIVPDAWADERHFKGVDQQTGLPLRSILTVPLWVKEQVIGVLQVVDTEVDRFSTTDQELLEPLSASAATAIENARLYEQARLDAETRSMLLREVNHRVKNNLSAIIGLLYAERRYARVEDLATCQSITNDLINQVHGLATVHSLLSASEWAPLRLSDLTAQVIRSSLQMLPRGKRISVDVTSSPVRVTADQAHNLALVINELATNTVKYALQERDTGRMAVRIRLDDEPAGRTILFEFRDDGPGYPEEVLQLKQCGVGFDLIQNVVRQGLRGELALHNAHGAMATIRFRAEA